MNVIDHIDGDPVNNKPSNLRDVTTSKNRAAGKNQCNASRYGRGISKRGKSFWFRACPNGDGKLKTLFRSNVLSETQSFAAEHYAGLGNLAPIDLRETN